MPTLEKSPQEIMVEQLAKQVTALQAEQKAREVNKDTLPDEWNWHVENQDKSDPIYYIADNSYWIAPAVRSSEA